MKQQSGFTLIELIVVIVILGILAATALPKFSNLSADARAQKMQAVAGALQGAAAMAHGQTLAESGWQASAVTLSDGSVIDMVNYYPTAGTSGVAAAIDGTGIASAIVGTTYQFYADGGRLNCVVSYTAPTTTSGVGSTPTIIAVSATATNCQ